MGIERVGIMVYLIGFCGVLGLAMFMERCIFYRKMYVRIRPFISGIRNQIFNRRITEAITICDETPGMIPQVVKAGIMSFDKSGEQRKAAMEREAVYQISRLEEGLTLLELLPKVTLLLGFLGSVFGVMKVFTHLIKYNLLPLEVLSTGMWKALLSASFGLATSIILYITYSFLLSWLRKYHRQIEGIMWEVYEILEEL